MVMISSGFPSPRTEQFPAGLRVLVVDDDPTWLKILEKMLKRCTYEVTTSGLAREALRLLRDRKDGFDIVISDVNMPDMDGFKLLEHVGLEMDLPVIMMSVDGETSRVMKGVQHGACDYLLKPIRMKELKNIWQHVMRKRLNEVRDIEFFEDRNGPDHSNDGHYGGGDQTLLKKRKDIDSKHDEKELSDTSSTKKARVVWTIELHQKFVNAVNQIGIDSDKIGPKKILDLMTVPWLTRENVASHLQVYPLHLILAYIYLVKLLCCLFNSLYLWPMGLRPFLYAIIIIHCTMYEPSFSGKSLIVQKYRLYLSRIRKEDKAESCNGGMENQDHSLDDPNLGQQNDVNSTYGYPGSLFPAQSSEAIVLDTDIKSSNLLPLTEHKKSFKRENSDPHEVSSQEIAVTRPFGPIEKAISYASFDTLVAAQYPCTAEIPEMQFETEFQQNPDLDVEQHQHAQASLMETTRHIDFRQPPISEINNRKSLSVNPMERPVEPFLVYPEAFGGVFDVPLDVNQSCGESGNAIKEQGPLPLERFIHSFPDVSQTHDFNTTLETKDQGCSQGNIMGLDSEQRNQDLERETSVELLGEDFMFCWLQGGNASSKDVGFDYLGLSDSNFPHHVSEAPMQSYVPRTGIDCEYLFDCLDHPFVDQGLLFS